MGVCACGRSTNENYLNDFWKALPIRGNTPQEYKTLIDPMLKDVNSIEAEKVFENIIEKHLSSSDHKSISATLWKDAKSKGWPKRFNEFLLALVFLTSPSDLKADGETFLSIGKSLVPGAFISEGEGEKKTISIVRVELQDVLDIYVNLISLYGVNYVKSTVPPTLQEDFENNLKEAYSKTEQTALLNKHFESVYQKKEAIPLDDFITKSLKYFADDTGIRDELFNSWRQKKDEQEKKEKEKEKEKNGDGEHKDKKDKKNKEHKKDKEGKDKDEGDHKKKDKKDKKEK
jgi:hypothetical protein